jgi:hypothetical protein
MRTARFTGIVTWLALLAACGGGGGAGSGSGGPPSFTSVTQVKVSQPSSYAADCAGAAQSGTLYPDTALEPSLIINPTNSANLVAEWQQDRWSNGGSQALNLAASFDGGTTWTLSQAAFSVCSGGAASNAGNFQRASNGWLTVSPNGVVYALSLSFDGESLLPGSSSGQLVAQSSDGGRGWSLPVALITDGADFFDDKGSITADPNDSNYVYAVWDRLESGTVSHGPSYFAMTADGGASWQSAVSIYDPGPSNQTIGNQIVVLPSGLVIDIFTEIDVIAGKQMTTLSQIQSSDHGASWSAPAGIAPLVSVGTVDPLTHQQVRDASLLFSVAVSAQGSIYVAWQDSSFSGGTYDGIALTQSSDGGQTWSQPVQVNADTRTPAFDPTVAVAADGSIAVTYYDFRNDTQPGAMLTDCWLVTSSDGVNFEEAHLSGPFDLDLAPYADGEGQFIGDYQSLRTNASGVLPLYTQTPPTGTQVSSTVVLAFPTGSAAAQAARAQRAIFRARTAPGGMRLDAAARERIAAHIRRVQARRLNRGR